MLLNADKVSNLKGRAQPENTESMVQGLSGGILIDGMVFRKCGRYALLLVNI